MSDSKFAIVQKLVHDAMHDHERQLQRGIEAFNRLTPSEQTAEQLRKWERILTGDIK